MERFSKVKVIRTAWAMSGRAEEDFKRMTGKEAIFQHGTSYVLDNPKISKEATLEWAYANALNDLLQALDLDDADYRAAKGGA